MAKISIIGGAGTLGAAVAFQLAHQRKVEEICLIDINQNLLKNHLMDLENAFSHKAMYSGTYAELINSDIVIITAGIPNRNDVSSRDAFLEGNIKLFQEFGHNIKKYAPKAVIITASNPVDVLNYYLYEEFHFHPRQLFGYTLNDSFRFEWAVRRVLSLPNETLFTPVLGEHGSSQVPVFSHVKRNGVYLNISIHDQKVIHDKLQRWFIDFNDLNINRTTGWTSAKGIGQLVMNVFEKRSFKTIGSAVFQGEYGLSDISMGAPLLIENREIQQIQEWDLTRSEKINYQTSANVISKSIKKALTMGEEIR